MQSSSTMEPIIKPGPRERDAPETVRINLFVPKWLREQVDRYADRQNLTFSEALRRLLSAGLGLLGRDHE